MMNGDAVELGGSEAKVTAAELDGVATDVGGNVGLTGSHGYGTMAVPGQLILSGDAHFTCGSGSAKECAARWRISITVGWSVFLKGHADASAL